MEDFKFAFGLIILKDVLGSTYVLQRVLVLAKHEEYLPLSLLLGLINFLLPSVVSLPIICLSLVLLRRAISGDGWNISLNSGLTCKMCQR